MFKKYQLKNKADIILVPQKGTKAVTVLVMYPVGSRYEPEKLSGVSHYIEHLMFKGTKKRKNTFVLTREIDRLGAEYNAFTGKEYTGYYIKIDEKYSETALDILSDMLFNSKFDPKDMEKEKGPIVEELRMYKDNPMMNIDNVFEDLLYNGCPLGRDIGGTEEHVFSYKRGDVLKFKDRFYAANNMTIVAAGCVTENIEKYVEEYFGRADNESGVKMTFKPYCLGSGKKTDRLSIKQKQTDQAQMMIGWPGFKHTAKENPAVSVISSILGGSMSSRLFIQIRERRGLAYHIRSGVENYRDTGYFYVRAGLDVKNINKAIAIIQNEIRKLIEKGVLKRELNDAKTHIRGALTLSMEDSSAQANWYARMNLFADRIKTPEEKLLEIERVTNDDIRSAAKKIFSMNRTRVAIIGDVKNDSINF